MLPETAGDPEDVDPTAVAALAFWQDGGDECPYKEFGVFPFTGVLVCNADGMEADLSGVDVCERLWVLAFIPGWDTDDKLAGAEVSMMSRDDITESAVFCDDDSADFCSMGEALEPE